LENRQVVYLDFKQRSIFNVKFVQGDINSSVLEFRITNNGVPVDISNQEVIVSFYKPDGTIVIQDSLTGVTVINATTGKVECILSSNTLAVTGIVKGEVDFSTAGTKLSTAQFTFNVTESLDNGDTLSVYVIPKLDAKIIDIQAQYNDDSARWNSDVNNKLAEATNKIAETEVTRQLAITATSNTNTAIANAQNAATLANSSANTTQLIWQTPVANFAALASTYPSAVIGWCAQTLDNNQWYRYSGTVWEYKGNFSITGAATVVSLNDVDKAKADMIRNQMHSGCRTIPAITTGSTTNLNSITIPETVYPINGYEIKMPLTILTLPTAPANVGEKWDDLVFLETYFPANGNGYTMAGRYRTVSNVNFIAPYTDGVNARDALVQAQGGNTVPLNYIYDWSASSSIFKYSHFFSQSDRINNVGISGKGISLEDVGLYIAGDGTSASKTALVTYDGYSYAIPLFRVKRRNSSGFSPSNANGARGYNPLTVTNGITNGQTNYVANISASTPIGSNYSVGEMLINTTGTLLGVITAINTVSNPQTITIGQSIGTLGGGGTIIAKSDHPQSLYANVIDSRDITDLRHETKSQYNYDYILKKADNMFNRGELSPKKMLTVHHGIPKSEVDGNTVFYASLDGTTVPEVGTTTLTNIPIPTYKPMPTGSGLQIPNTGRVSCAFASGLTSCTLDAIFKADDFFAITSNAQSILNINDGTNYIGLNKNPSSTSYYLIGGNGTNNALTFTLAKPNTPFIHIRIRITSTNMYVFLNGVQVATIGITNLSSANVGYIGSTTSGYGYVGAVSDISISNIDRGSLFPNLPPDFISGDAIIMPAYTNQRRISSEAQMPQTVNSIVKATNLLNSRGINRVVIGTPNTWSAGDTITVTGMAGELISGVFDTDTAKSTLVKDALSTDTSAYFDIVDATLYSDGDTVKLVDRVLGTLLATKIINTGGVDAVNKKLTFTETIGVALSKYQVVAMESTATSSNPKVYYMNGTTKTEVVGDAVTPWTGMFGNVATFKLGTNASLVAQDLQIDYSMIMPSGQPALSVPTTTTLMGEAGFRLPYANQTITSDYVSKISGRTWENPNIAKTLSAIVANNPAPSTFVDELITSEYAKMFIQDGTVTTFSTNVNGKQACVLLSFDLIKESERKLGCKIPAKTKALKVTWLKNNLNRISCLFKGHGSSPSGNKATLTRYNNTGNFWNDWDIVNTFTTSSTVATLSIPVPFGQSLLDSISVDGYAFFLCFADPSDGITPSTINVDFASLDITFSDKIVISMGLATGQTVDVRDDFAGKTAGDVVGNPNIAKYSEGSSTLKTPSQFTVEMDAGRYSGILALDNTLTGAYSYNGNMAQQLFSFNLIRIVEDKMGTIPAIDKVQWLKNNLLNIDFNWWGYGTNPSGNYATISTWNGVWTAQSYNTLGSVSKVSGNVNESNANVKLSACIQSDGFVHFLSWANASNGEITSTIYTDYCNIELTFKKPTGYDVLSPSNPRRDAGLSNILFVRKETKEVQSMFPYSNEFMLTTYSDYLEAPTPISANTDVTILAEIPEFLITDLGSAVGNKQGIHHWMNLTYRVGQDKGDLYGELGFSVVKFAPDSKDINVGSKVTVNATGFSTAYWKQYALATIGKPMVGIARYLVLVGGELKLLVFSKYSATGGFTVDGTGVGILVNLPGKPLSKEADGVVRAGVNTPTAWKSGELIPMGYVDKATNKLITTGNSI